MTLDHVLLAIGFWSLHRDLLSWLEFLVLCVDGEKE